MKRYKKPYRLKRKKSIFRNRFFWLGTLAVLILSFIFYFLFFSKIFQVKKIIIAGQEKVSSDDLKLLAESKLESKILFFSTKSIFLVNLDIIKKDILNNFPQIAEVEIHRQFPDGINISAAERQGLAILCRETDCFLLDKEGVIFDPVRNMISNGVEEASLIKIIDHRNIDHFVLAERVIEKELLSQIFEIQLKLQENLKILITEASIMSEERLNLKTQEGWEIYFNLKGDLDWQITELSLVLEKQIPPEKRGNLEYIDLRFTRVFIQYNRQK